MIYVDDLIAYGGSYRGKDADHAARVGAQNGHRWCHLFTDGPVAELHAFAASIGLRAGWFQPDRHGGHYDLTPGRRAAAVALGAREVDRKTAVALWRAAQARIVEGRKAAAEFDREFKRAFPPDRGPDYYD